MLIYQFLDSTSFVSMYRPSKRRYMPSFQLYGWILIVRANTGLLNFIRTFVSLSVFPLKILPPSTANQSAWFKEDSTLTEVTQ